MARHFLVCLNGTFVQERQKDAREVDQCCLQKLVRFGIVLVPLVRYVEVGHGDAVGPVGQLGQVPLLLPLREEFGEPVVLLGADGIEVDHEEDSDGVVVGVQAEDQLAELEGCAVAGAGTHKVQVPEESDEKGSGRCNNERAN